MCSTLGLQKPAQLICGAFANLTLGQTRRRGHRSEGSQAPLRCGLPHQLRARCGLVTQFDVTSSCCSSFKRAQFAWKGTTTLCLLYRVP